MIDPADESTWPAVVFNRVREWAERCRGASSYTPDLPVEQEEEEGFRAAFAGHLLRGYHCTCLLPHEVDGILREGLKPLDRELIERRVREATIRGYLSEREGDDLRRSNAFTEGEDEFRVGQVCLVLSTQLFRSYHVDGVSELLTTWGGEAVYRWARSGGCRLPIGVPSIVVAQLDIADPTARHLCFPALHRVFVGSLLRLADAAGEVFYRAPVPPERIERIIQPGHPEYDSLVLLPR